MRLASPVGTQRLASRNYWKSLVPANLHGLPGLSAVMNEVLAHPCIKLEVLPTTVLASKLLNHANNLIRAVPVESKFKIGLTVHPVHRWQNPQYGYNRETSLVWSKMRLVCILQYGESAGMMEAALIQAWASDHRCVNEAGGGESVLKQAGPFFIYVVVSAC